MNKPNDLAAMYRDIQKQKVTTRYLKQRLPPQRIAVRTGALQFGDNEPGIYIEPEKARFFLGVIAQAQANIKDANKYGRQLACEIDLNDIKAVLNANT